MVSACPDTTNVKLAGVHDGMGALARNTTETRPPGEKESEVLAAAFSSSDRGRSTDGPAGSTTVIALSSPPRTIFCRPSLQYRARNGRSTDTQRREPGDHLILRGTPGCESILWFGL